MSRIDRIFQQLQADGRKALMPFVTAGDPSLEATEQIIPALGEAGASICELGIPFSDPVADGPVIQAAMTRALDRGTRLDAIFEMVARVRPKTEIGIVAMVSYSIVFRRGVEQFVSDAKDAGVDGFIFPDLPIDEAASVRPVVDKAGLIMSMLIAPTTPIERAQEVAAASSGFCYVVSRAGITGEQTQLPPDLQPRLEKLRAAADLPLAVGFGISTADHVRQVVEVADAAIVGSALVRRLAEAEGGDAGAAAEAKTFTQELAAGLSPAGSTG